MNDRDKQILEEFSKNLKDFIVDFHNSFSENHFVDVEREKTLAEVAEKSATSNRIFGNHVEWYEKRIAEVEAKMINETGASLDFYQIELNRLNKGLERTTNNNVTKRDKWRELAIDAQKISDIEKERIKDQIKENFKKLSDYLGPITLSSGVGHTLIVESLIKKYDGDLELALETYNRLRARIDNPDEKSNKTELRKEANKVYADIKRLRNVTASLRNFLTAYQGLEQAFNSDNVFENFGVVEDYFYTFADTLDVVEQTVDSNLLTVNIKENADGTFDLDVNCGYRFMEPAARLTRDQLTGDKIREYLEQFAHVLSTKTNFTYDGLVNGDVVLKYNDELVKKDSIGKIGDLTDEIRKGNIDKVKADNGLDNQPPQQSNGDDSQVLGDGDNQPSQQNNGNDSQSLGDGDNQPSQQNNGNDSQSLGDGDNQPSQQNNGNAPQNPGDGNTQPSQQNNGSTPQTPGDGDNQPAQQNNGNDSQSLGDGDNQPSQQNNGNDSRTLGDGNALPIQPNLGDGTLSYTDQHAMKVTASRNASSKFFNTARLVTGMAAIGLGFAGPALGVGTAGALVAGAAFTLVTGFQGIGKIQENCKYFAMKHKLKRTAKKISKETGLDIHFATDLKSRKAGFVLGEPEKDKDMKFLTSDDLRSAEFAEGLDDVVLDIFDNAFEKTNSYRGKGEAASGFKEVRYKRFPKITFDDVTAAFNEFGGVKSFAELNGYRFDFNKVINSRRKEQADASLINNGDGVVAVDDYDDLYNDLNNDAQNVVNTQNVGQDAPSQGVFSGAVDPNAVPSIVNPQGPDASVQNTQGTPNPSVANQTGGDNGQDLGQTEPVPPLSPISQGNDLDSIMGALGDPYENQDLYKSDIESKVNSVVTDINNSVEVEYALRDEFAKYNDTLSPQSKIDLVNLFHEKSNFTQEQMNKFDLLCKENRTLTDSEVTAKIQEFETIRQQQGEMGLGEAVARFMQENQSLTKEDLETLHKFDASKNMGFEEAINSKFNGQAPKK